MTQYARRITDSDESRRLYKLHQQAKQTDGPCEVCGWRDGDGVRTCFYSAELGAVTHQNSEAGAEATMTPAQRSLFRLRMVPLPVRLAAPSASRLWTPNIAPSTAPMTLPDMPIPSASTRTAASCQTTSG